MGKSYMDHETATINSLKDDPAFAAEYLSAVIGDGEPSEIMTALRRISEAKDGVSAIAASTNLNAKSLYRTLSSRGNPRLKNLLAILSALNLKLSVTPKPGHIKSG